MVISFLVEAVLISLTGVLAPGPITVATMVAGTRRPHAGALVALGHAVVEFPLMILVLAITKANSTDADAMKAQYHFVANPPGEVVYPGEFSKARRLLFAGKDINYEGASGPCDLDETNNVKTTPYLVWGVDAIGIVKLIEVFGSAE